MVVLVIAHSGRGGTVAACGEVSAVASAVVIHLGIVALASHSSCVAARAATAAAVAAGTGHGAVAGA